MRLAACLTLCLLGSSAQAASFDCTKAQTPDEVAVCGNPQLSELDTLVGRAYREAQKQGSDAQDKGKALADAKSFNIRKRACKANVACLTAAYVGALEDFQTLGSAVAVPDAVAATDMVAVLPPESKVLPVREGDCVQSRITEIGGRLEGDKDFSSGTSVFFANEGHQVSYDKVPGIIASRPGDRVLMCLTSIPKHCPPGDDRGRSYTTTNLRTHKTWSLADSQHMCGGA